MYYKNIIYILFLVNSMNDIHNNPYNSQLPPPPPPPPMQPPYMPYYQPPRGSANDWYNRGGGGVGGGENLSDPRLRNRDPRMSIYYYINF